MKESHTPAPRAKAITAALLALLVLAPAAAHGAAPQGAGDQVVRVHYDYMVKTTGADPHSDAPDPAYIQAVVDVFKAHGISLLIDPVHNAIPEKEYIWVDGQAFPDGTDFVSLCQQYSPSLGVNSTNSVSVYDLRAQYFKQQEPNVHYVVFGYAALSSGSGADCTLGSGAAELPGDNFAVGLGFIALPREPQTSWPGYPWGMGSVTGVNQTDPLERLGLTLFWGGTFMHELGHNLGLQHGGGDGINYKPNYFSVMNYAYQFNGIPAADEAGSNVTDPYLSHLDYSETACPTLNELDLNESAGINCGGSDVAIAIPDLYGTSCLTPYTFAPATGPVDWNCDGVIQPHVAADINWNGYDTVYQTLKGFDDWAEVHDCISSNCSFDTSIPRVVSDDPFTSSPAPWGVTFHTTPSAFPGSDSPGSISACNRVLTDGQSAMCSPSFTASANLPSPSAGWEFVKWSYSSPALSCDSIGAAQDMCFPQGPSDLTAVFGARVTFHTAFGQILLYDGSEQQQNQYSCTAGESLSDGESAFLVAGQTYYACMAGAPLGHNFETFACDGGVACSGGGWGTVVASGPGNVTAEFDLAVTQLAPSDGAAVYAADGVVKLEGAITMGGEPFQSTYAVYVWSYALPSPIPLEPCTGLSGPDGQFSCDFAPPVAGVQYHWYVIAGQNENYWSGVAWSSYDSSFFFYPYSGPTVTLYSPYNGSSITSADGSVWLAGQMTVPTGAADGYTSYEVFAGSSPSLPASDPACAGTTDSTGGFYCSISEASGLPLQSGQTYYWYVAAVAPDGSTMLSTSDTWSFTYAFDASCPASGCLP